MNMNQIDVETRERTTVLILNTPGYCILRKGEIIETLVILNTPGGLNNLLLS